ncbi:hypothetical protein K3495_g481 [Podosphaera aphanis]|nr:hypothetical protein K3495_g481 [Podosphaera aphanis]
MIPSSSATTSTTNLALPLAEPTSSQHSSLSIADGVGIRPRNKKLKNKEESQASKSGTNIPNGTRAASPAHERNHGLNAERKRRSRTRTETFIEETERTKTDAAKKSVWEGSWASQRLNALQEMAFSMMAGDSHSDGHKSTRPRPSKNDGWFAASAGKGRPQCSWGPKTSLPSQNDARIGIGVEGEREDKLKERKKARMLEGRDDGASLVDSAGNYKRRTSIEETRPSGQEEDDHTLVYVYHVQPEDTLQGVVLKFHSKMDVFKKANRLWAGDSIQVRKRVYLPVDSCAIKGRPCPAPPDISMEADLIAPPSNSEKSLFSKANDLSIETSIERASDDDTPWTHVRWVLLDSLPSKPIEIIRISRKTLNYFPPRRRKSFANMSAFSTPRISSDFPTLSRSSIDSQTSNPSRKTSTPYLGLSHLTPISSNSLPSPDSLSNSLDRLGWLRGPGGVGTLGKNVRKPGPAKDALNTWTSKRFPSIAIDSLPSTSTVGSENVQLYLNERELDNLATESVTSTHSGPSSNGLSFPNVNLNSVEGWVRKIATKVQTPGTPREDAIEMLDGPGNGDGRGFDLVSGASYVERSIGRRRNDYETSVRERGKCAKSE